MVHTFSSRGKKQPKMPLQIILCLFTVFHFTIAMGTLQNSTSKSINNIAKPGCPSHCGDVTVPYPFGIGTGCSLDNSFYVMCNETYEPPKLFLRSTNIEIYSISDREIRIHAVASYACYNQDGALDAYKDYLISIKPFTFSVKNKFTAIGCHDYALIQGMRNGASGFSSGCLGVCSKAQDVPNNGQCSGLGCCQTSIPKNLDYYNVTLYTFQNHTDVGSAYNRCSYAFLGEPGRYVFRGVRDLSSASGLRERIESTVHVVVDWVIAPDRAPGRCFESNECKGNSSCDDVDGGYRCKCNKGYEGNPYLHPGCQDINECEVPEINSCFYGDCINTLGGYNCTHTSESFDDAITEDCCQDNKDSKSPSIMFIIFIAFVSTFVAVLAILLAILCGKAGIAFRKMKRNEMRLREKFFLQNGGAFLNQKIHEAMTLFSSKQLRKATGNYSQKHIIDQGTHGVVYKGVLRDKRVVTIKKTRIHYRAEERFIDELLTVTKVIHPNVVRLLGCCLEEEDPLLVYEFISNNTLFYHIHHTTGGMSWLTWENRLRVAIEAATALAYLHSEPVLGPIIHRDVKSTHILLDENYTAKVSNFGVSRLLPLGREPYTTVLDGYLDYASGGRLTERSDVYSFGVVLAELITGKKPEGVDVGRNLASYFVNAVEENQLFEILEPQILAEGTPEQLQAIGYLVYWCLNSKGCLRPTMKVVARELKKLRDFTTHSSIQKRHETTVVQEAEQSDHS